MPLPETNCTGPKWSKKMNGPTICRLPCGSARRTSNPSPRSRVRGTITSSSASQDAASPSTGSLEGSQLMGSPLNFCYHNSIRQRGGKTMLAKSRPDAKLVQLDGPTIETPRLILRQWRSADIAPYPAMLADPATARFITVDGKPVEDVM